MRRLVLLFAAVAAFGCSPKQAPAPKLGASLLYPGRVTQQQLATQPQIIGTVALGNAITVVSPAIDAFAAPGTLVTVVPALGAGLRFVPMLTRALVVTRTGTVTGNPAAKLGTNGAHDNMTPAIAFVPSAANVSLADPGDVFVLTVSTLTGKASINGAPELNAPVVYEQVTAATGGGAALTYMLALSGFVSDFP